MSEIAEFFANKTVFVTGATGFVGKTLVEKLVRSCSRVSKVFILARPKKNVSVKERERQFFEDPIFEGHSESDLVEKIEFVSGDVTEPKLGLSPDDVARVSSIVQIVFHCAADVHYQRPLKDALRYNTVSTTEVMSLIKSFLRLEAFVYCSTAYTNVDIVGDLIEERLYPAPFDIPKFIELIDLLPEEVVKDMTPGLIAKKLNTYKFTNFLAETVVCNNSGDIPTALVRPPGISAAFREPCPGWGDQATGVQGALIVIGRGILHTLHGKKSIHLNIVAVDVLANMLISSAWFVAKNKSTPMFFNATPPMCTLGDFEAGATVGFSKIGFDKSNVVFPVSFYIFENRILFLIVSFFYNTILGGLGDIYLRLSAKKPKLSRIMKKIQHAFEVYDYFLNRPNKWEYRNFDKLAEKMSSADRETFFFSDPTLSWNSYFINSVIGLKKYVLHEKFCEKEARESAKKAFESRSHKGVYAILAISGMFLFLSIWFWRLFM